MTIFDDLNMKFRITPNVNDTIISGDRKHLKICIIPHIVI